MAVSLEAVLAPIAADAPAGVSVRYEPEFDALKSEVEKIGGLGAAVDWSKVVALSEEILGRRSKDLLVVSYLVVGLFHTEGYKGLAQGLGALRTIMESFWETLFPEAKRPRARVAAFEWLVERGAATTKQRNAEAGETDAVKRSVDLLDEIASWLSGQLGPDAPSFREWSSALAERLVAAPSPVAAAARAAPTAAAAAPAHDLSSPDGREAALRGLMPTLKALAFELRKANPQDPLAYRAARFAAWLRLRALPPHTGGKTTVPAVGVSKELFSRLDASASRGEWLAVLEQAESQFSQTILWLDAHRYVAQAMSALGPPFERARAVVVDELAEILHQIPGLTDLQFEGGVPFASDETKAWIAQEVLARSADSSATGGPATPVDEEEGPDLIDAARESLRAGKIDAAIARLSDAIREATDGRRRLRRRLEMVQILGEAKELRLAASQILAVQEEIDRHRIEEWDPALAASALQLLLRWQRALAKSEGKGSVEAQKAEQMYARLARLDPRAALSMKG